MAQAITNAKGKHGFHLWAYVFMPEHVHLLIWPAREAYSISDILGTIKQSVSRKAMTWLRENTPGGLRCLATGRKDKPWRFWQEGGGYDRNVRNGKALIEMMGYIHNNPVRRGLVARPEDWKWASAQDWSELRPGAVPIDKESFLNSVV